MRALWLTLAVLPTLAPAQPTEERLLDLSTLRRDASAGEPRDAFETKSWYVPPPPPPPAAPARVEKMLPPAPTAPQLPFSFLGQYEEDGRLVVLLMQGERMLVVKPGDVIEGKYRVEGIDGRLLTLTYLPLGIKQTLDVGGPG